MKFELNASHVVLIMHCESQHACGVAFTVCGNLHTHVEFYGEDMWQAMGHDKTMLHCLWCAERAVNQDPEHYFTTTEAEQNV